MNGRPEIIDRLLGYIDQFWHLALGWGSSPAAWSQFALLLLAWGLAVLTERKLLPRLRAALLPISESHGLLPAAIRIGLRFLPMILPLIAYGFTALGEAFTRSVFGSGAVIALGKRLFLFFAARLFVTHVLHDRFLRFLGNYVLIPVAAAYALGLSQLIGGWLESLTVEMGNITFSVMALIRGLVAGSLLFWLGSWSNRQSADYIKSQEELRPATRELAAKAAEAMIFGVAFLLLLQIMGINLTTIALLGGALGVGIGLGLQQIAANFISGIILLVEGQTTVGDYVELDGGEKGTIVRMTARACILETFDGRWIVVPNEHFITSRVVNYSDQGSANRYEVAFSVSYETEIEKVPALIETAVAGLSFVLGAPSSPGCELRGFGESSVDFAVEYWVSGIDDGKNNYSSQVLFAVWRALKEAGIEMPYPRRVIEMRTPVTGRRP